MKRHVKNSLQWLTFDLLSDIPNLIHGVFTRHGGVSQGPYHSLNLGCHDDDFKNLETNLNLVKQVLNLPNIHYAKQCHGVDSSIITHSNCFEKRECDILMTNQKGIGLKISHADCQAAIFYDPVHQALAVVHAGWRGNVQNIYAKTVEQMKRQYGTVAQDLLVCISPSLGPTAAEFTHYQKELPESFWDFQVKLYYFDLWSISQWQLQNVGVLPHHIEIARLCTYCNEEDFFSYRRRDDKSHTTRYGCNGTIAALN